MNDIIAITKTDNLMDEIQKSAPGRFLVGDAAYELTEHGKSGLPAVQHMTLMMQYSIPSFINAAGQVFEAFAFFFMGCLTISFNTRLLT